MAGRSRVSGWFLVPGSGGATPGISSHLERPLATVDDSGASRRTEGLWGAGRRRGRSAVVRAPLSESLHKVVTGFSLQLSARSVLMNSRETRKRRRRDDSKLLDNESHGLLPTVPCRAHPRDVCHPYVDLVRGPADFSSHFCSQVSLIDDRSNRARDSAQWSCV